MFMCYWTVDIQITAMFPRKHTSKPTPRCAFKGSDKLETSLLRSLQRNMPTV